AFPWRRRGRIGTVTRRHPAVIGARVAIPIGLRLPGHCLPLVRSRRIIGRGWAVARLLSLAPGFGVTAIVALALRRGVLRRCVIILIGFFVAPFLPRRPPALGDARRLGRAFRACSALRRRFGGIFRRRARRLVDGRCLFDRRRRGCIPRGLGLVGGFGGGRGGCGLARRLRLGRRLGRRLFGRQVDRRRSRGGGLLLHRHRGHRSARRGRRRRRHWRGCDRRALRPSHARPQHQRRNASKQCSFSRVAHHVWVTNAGRGLIQATERVRAGI